MEIISLGGAVKKANAYTDEKVASISSGMNYKGSVSNYASLPANAKKGDVYTTSDDGNEYVWDSTQWVKLGANYTAGDGLSLSGSQFSLNRASLVPTITIASKITFPEYWELLFTRINTSSGESTLICCVPTINSFGRLTKAVIWSCRYIDLLKAGYFSTLETDNYYTKSEIDTKLASLLTYGGD